MCASVSGVAYSHAPIISGLNSQIELIALVNTYRDQYSGEYLDPVQEPTVNNQTRFINPFFLKDREKQILVLDYYQADIDLAMQKIASKTNKIQLNLSEKIASFVILLINLIGKTFKKSYTIIRGLFILFIGVKIAVVNEEYGIQLDSFLNVIGDVTWNKEQNMLSIKNPLYISLSK